MQRKLRRYLRYSIIVLFYWTMMYWMRNELIPEFMTFVSEEAEDDPPTVVGQANRDDKIKADIVPSVSSEGASNKIVNPVATEALRGKPPDQGQGQKGQKPEVKRPIRRPLPPDMDQSYRLSEEEQDQWEEAYYKLQSHSVNPYKYTNVVTPDHLCDEGTTLLILVHSHPSYEERRQAIRKTWGSVAKGAEWPRRELKGSVRLAFVLGQPRDHAGADQRTKEEGRLYNDILQGSFIDDYKNMTLKSLLGLRYFDEHCSQAKTLLKSDDDMILNLPYILDYLDESPMSWSIMGPLNPRSKVIRNGKWGIPMNVFPLTYYPPFESGSAYLIAGDLVGELFKASEFVSPIFIDDVYITGILGKILNVYHIEKEGFSFWRDRKPTSCDINEDLKITGTNLSPDALLKIWEEIEQDVKHCPTPPQWKIGTPSKHQVPPQVPLRRPKRIKKQGL